MSQYLSTSLVQDEDDMKPGDLVRHPKGMENVCSKRYAAGLVLKVWHPVNPPGRTQYLVLWCTMVGPCRYSDDQLELVQ